MAKKLFNPHYFRHSFSFPFIFTINSKSFQTLFGLRLSSTHPMLTRILFLLLLAGTAASAQKLTSVDSLITGKPFTEYVKHLSSDAFQGRKPFSRGEEVTVKYLETEFKKMGLKPGNNQSYFQDVPLVDILSKPSTTLKLAGKAKELTLHYLTDYVAASRWTDAKVSLESSEMVFVGYGIVAPEFGWNDYQDLNVKGKTVLVLVNDPGLADSTLFKGKTMTYYGRWTYKFEEAARQGAAGVLLIHDTKAASYPWDVVRSGWSKSKLYLQSPDNNHSRAKVEGWLSKETTEKLLSMAGQSTDLYQQAAKRGFKAVPLGVKASIALDNQVKASVSKNVLAYLPGTNRAEEVLIYTAHWDHFGKGEPINGDSIYNGAADNATGVAAIMELAKAFTQLKKKPSRSLLFMSVTGEEQGLLGSEYYATHPVYPLSKTIANINLDILQPFGRMKDVIVVGKGQSDLDELVEEAARKQGRFTRPEFNPAGGWYFRSDHFNFAKVGVPSMYLENGVVSIEHGEAWGRKKKEDYNTNHYHKPSDEYDPNWDLSGIIEDMRLLFNVGYKLTTEPVYPGWKKDSEFKNITRK